LANVVFKNVNVFDGSGSDLTLCNVQVEGNKITSVSPKPIESFAYNTKVIDGKGATLMPGLIESHAHLGFGSNVYKDLPLGPHSQELRLLRTLECAEVMLDFGYTGSYSGGAINAKAEVHLRDEINAGRLKGPRIKACSFERAAQNAAVVSEKGKSRKYDGIAHRDPDVKGMRDFVKEMADIGVDSIKMLLSGESAIVLGSGKITQFYEEEVAAAADEAKKHKLNLNAHAYYPEAIDMALRHGFDALYHCSFADEATVAQLIDHKEDIFVAPGIGILWASIHNDWPIGTPEKVQSAKETLESVRQLAPKLRSGGVRYLPGGDKDLELFVDHLEIPAKEVLTSATKYGGELMGMGNELGLIAPNYLADLILVSGDVTKDITLLTEKKNIPVVMKDGEFHRCTL